VGQGLIIEVSKHNNTTFGRTPLKGWSARRRHLYLTINNIEKRKTSITQGIRTTIPASERPQNHALDCEATGICSCIKRNVQVWYHLIERSG